ncbi:MAG: hypothetical protein RSE13_18755 [Planktothrix sp. GU0601_MAG3]|nr:MAG: hypothetical protein RSE13_18755 [Planktothrix sp. GU0601_MAG3]
MINKYLLDTNILIYYFNDGSEVQPIFDEIEVKDAEAFYCPISWVELLKYWWGWAGLLRFSVRFERFC